MLAVLEKSLPPYTTCDFALEKPATANDACPEDFVPAVPVCLPELKRLDDPRALSEARSNVAAALEELRLSERALENHLRGLQAFMNRAKPHASAFRVTA